MRLLIMGGSWFLGRTLATDALARGWQVTAFSRGRSGLPPAGVDHLRGDRTSEGDLQRLAMSGPWDAVVDTSAFEPADVTRVLNALDAHVGRYVLVSTVSAYRDWPERPVSETSPLWPSDPNLTADSPELASMAVGARYGTLKAGCEEAIRSRGSVGLIVRPGVILGPGEYVGRGLKLLKRAARGGAWLVPGPRDQTIQPVDVRDVSSFVLNAIEGSRSGAYNLVAPQGFATYGHLVETCIDLTGGRATPVWVDPNWLLEQGVKQWTELPLWRVPDGTWKVDSSRAVDAGLACRPLRETLSDFQAAFDRDGLVDHPRQDDHGMSPEREANLLSEWEIGGR